MEDFKFKINLVKSAEEDGERYVYGIASTESIDGDGDIVEASGLKKSSEWYIKNGIIDWDHKSIEQGDPSAIIGKPMELKWDGQNRAHFKGILFKGVKKAEDVWNLMQAKGAELGFSVGGKILDKKTFFDPKLNKNVSRITKVFMNHMAITPFPSNKDSFATAEPYSMFFKSLSVGSELGEEAFDRVAQEEATKIQNLTKMMAATGNPVQEGTGGVKQGAHTVSEEDLESNVKKMEILDNADKEKVGPGGHVPNETGPHGRGKGPGEGKGDGTGKKRIKLNKNLSIEISGDDITINTYEQQSEVITDKELGKSSNLDKAKIVESYIELLKSMSEGSKEAQDVSEFLIKRGLGRSSRRIISRHLSKKISDLLSDDGLLKRGKTFGAPYENANVNATCKGYTKQGVTYGAQEDSEFIPKSTPSSPTGKRMLDLVNDSNVQELMVKDCTLNELRHLDEQLDTIEYDALSDKALFERFNNIREAYHKPLFSKEQFDRVLKINKYEIIQIIRNYDRELKEQMIKVMGKTMEWLKGRLDNENQNPMDTQKFRSMD